MPKSRVVLISFGVLVLVVLMLAALAAFKTMQPGATLLPLSQTASKEDEGREVLRGYIKTAFSGQESKGILAYIDLAFSQKTPQEGYQYLKKAFDKMAVSLKETKSTDKTFAMNKLKTYVSILPNYIESDFVILK
ncbi:MAG: hypothetical protein ACD_38C00192G0007 [uncultured bacterium]|uniref:Uncharacterized protein n=1 Tax=Candidatus Daviesbacteria bacterium GW2011_GWC2_40_12 TaxID=1618431 RepID=A0A0G0QMY0_9BACT|nr:MAG: hypothetical protein ACD_38C00192G0007 [uncultured bacterium]KKQ84858.1 MAG: hypothetical protein UT04_C0011G0032 [Candidatus Daviesbacteria bacterium GW2011_GWF2_38_7]KKR16509.1 MAG: hypothetical protein UT45_C0005G0038 [Candidatus Daviesbacteria bacterium GW2011_GWA2_39_33]KKR41774.1 MAG: hypothetical protein UT77_C0006G0006 [Candidatus Daviesbacteria bacterium GW2011_GWC2_40_12]OGE21145.1 MAG: hypothetical protein A2778_02880 [Candidatus Daviesbacteria bacterium RIFCSPHIGHO2_01_FULL_